MDCFDRSDRLGFQLQQSRSHYRADRSSATTQPHRLRLTENHRGWMSLLRRYGSVHREELGISDHSPDGGQAEEKY